MVFFPLGGSTLALWSSRLEPLKRPEFHLYDRDESPPAEAKYQAQVDEVNKRTNCTARSTEKREIENYLHPKAIVAAYAQNGIDITIDRSFADFADVPDAVAMLVHEASGSAKAWDDLDDDEQGKKEGKAKRILNGIAPRFMTKQLLEDVDPNGDLVSWFEDIKGLMESVER